MQTASKFSYRLLPKVSDSSSLCPHSYSQEDYTLHWPIEDTHPHHFNIIAEKALLALQRSYQEQSAEVATRSEPTRSALLIPIIQAGQFNIREEESIFQQLFRYLRRNTTAKRPLLNFTSGYFSLYQPYQDLLLETQNLDCQIVAASPKVCGAACICTAANAPLGERFLRIQRNLGKDSRRLYPL